jgi:glycosyltransferase involved in cell wall biosynthesis
LENWYIRNQFTRVLKNAKDEGREVILHIWGPGLLTPLLIEWAEDQRVPSIYHEMGEADREYITTWHLEGTVQAINRANLAIAVSPSMAENIRDIFGYRGRIIAIHDLIIDPGEAWTSGRKKGERTAFGAIGRLVPHKRHTELLYAIKELCDEGHDVALVIASDGPMRKPLEALSLQLGIQERVTFLGEFERLEEVMSQFDIFVLTSSSESQCMPVTESMAYGKPVVVSDFGGIPDFVQDGVTGFLVPVGEPSRLLEAMRKLAVDPALREAMGSRGRERYVELYKPNRAVDMVEQAYASLLG